MKKIAWVLVFILAVVACKKEAQQLTENPSENVEETQQEPKSFAHTSSIFRNDGFYDNLESEWIRVDFGDEGKINEIWYWNDAKQEKKQLKFTAENFNSPFNFKGELKFADSNINLNFTLIDDVLMITHQDQMQQQFLLESKGIETNPSK